MEHYIVEYIYYQHNSGAADNGFYTGEWYCSNVKEATDIRDKIRASAKAKSDGKHGERDAKLEDQLIGYTGYFVSAEAYIETVERVLLR